MSIAQLMKLVVFAGATCACVVPALEFDAGGNGRGTIFAFELIVIPLVWAALALLMVKFSPHKDLIVIALILISLSVALCALLWLSTTVLSDSLKVRAAQEVVLTELIAAGAGVCVLGNCWLFLLSRLVRELRRMKTR